MTTGLGKTTAQCAGQGCVTAVQDAVRLVLGEYQAAYFALNALASKVEDLRILSLNAELAAGRAGPSGAAIKVATHNTRELVSLLSQASLRMNVARYRCYRFGALALRGLPRIGRFGRTAEKIRAAAGPYAESGLAALEGAIRQRAGHAVEELNGLVTGGRELEKLAKGLKGLVLQAVAIANTMAIEATSVSGHQAVFTVVANDMQRHIQALKAMVDQASAHVALGNTAAASITAYIEKISRQIR